jgi:tetratricopeptide (TPR) repeat protein
LPDLERATQLNKLSGQYFENGDFAAALKAAENATRLIVTANKISQTATDYRLTSADAYQHSALAKARLGRFEEAKKDQAASLELIQSVSSNSPEGPDLRERLAAALVNMGAICMEANEFEEAERHFHSAIKLRSEVPDLQTLPEVKRLLAAAHDRLADLEFRQKKYDDAAKISSLSISMLEPLRTENAGDPLLRELSAAYDIQAKAAFGAGNPNLALALREKEFAIVEQLAARDPNNMEWQHDLALSLDERGQVLEKLQKSEAALRAYTDAISIGETLIARSSIPIDWPRDTARTLFHRSVLLGRLGQPAEALNAARRMTTILEKLASSSLEIVSDANLETAYRLARGALLASNRPTEAMDTAEQQLFAISLVSDREGIDFSRVAQVLNSLCWTALFAGDIQRAEVAGRQASVLDPGLQLNYAHALMYAGKLEQAKKIYLGGLSVGGEKAIKWRKDIADDFAALSARNLQHPLMAEIKRAMGP